MIPRYKSLTDWFDQHRATCSGLMAKQVGTEGVGGFQPREIYQCETCGEKANVPWS